MDENKVKQVEYMYVGFRGVTLLKMMVLRARMGKGYVRVIKPSIVQRRISLKMKDFHAGISTTQVNAFPEYIMVAIPKKVVEKIDIKKYLTFDEEHLIYVFKDDLLKDFIVDLVNAYLETGITTNTLIVLADGQHRLYLLLTLVYNWTHTHNKNIIELLGLEDFNKDDRFKLSIKKTFKEVHNSYNAKKLGFDEIVINLWPFIGNPSGKREEKQVIILKFLLGEENAEKELDKVNGKVNKIEYISIHDIREEAIIKILDSIFMSKLVLVSTRNNGNGETIDYNQIIALITIQNDYTHTTPVIESRISWYLVERDIVKKIEEIISSYFKGEGNLETVAKAHSDKRNIDDEKAKEELLRMFMPISEYALLGVFGSIKNFFEEVSDKINKDISAGVTEDEIYVFIILDVMLFLGGEKFRKECINDEKWDRALKIRKKIYDRLKGKDSNSKYYYLKPILYPKFLIDSGKGFRLKISGHISIVFREQLDFIQELLEKGKVFSFLVPEMIKLVTQNFINNVVTFSETLAEHIQYEDNGTMRKRGFSVKKNKISVLESDTLKRILYTDMFVKRKCKYTQDKKGNLKFIDPLSDSLSNYEFIAPKQYILQILVPFAILPHSVFKAYREHITSIIVKQLTGTLFNEDGVIKYYDTRNRLVEISVEDFWENISKNTANDTEYLKKMNITALAIQVALPEMFGTELDVDKIRVRKSKLVSGNIDANWVSIAESIGRIPIIRDKAILERNGQIVVESLNKINEQKLEDSLTIGHVFPNSWGGHITTHNFVWIEDKLNNSIKDKYSESKYKEFVEKYHELMLQEIQKDIDKLPLNRPLYTKKQSTGKW